MNYIRKHRYLFLLAIDIFIVIISYILAYFFRLDTFVKYQFNPVIKYMFIPILLNLLISNLLDEYNTLWRYTATSDLVKISLGAIIANGIWLFVLFVVKIPFYIRSLPIIAGMIIILLKLFIRVIYKAIFASEKSAEKKERVVIVGAGDAGAVLVRELKMSDRYNVEIVGFIDDNKQKINKRISGFRIIGSTDDLKELKEKYKFNSVYIAIPSASKEQLKIIIEKCNSVNLNTKILQLKEQKDIDNRTSMRDVSIDDLLGRGEVKLNTAQIEEHIKDKVIMVTGAGGSIGSEICRQLLPFKPKMIVMMDIYENNMYSLQQSIKIENMNGKYLNTEIVCLIGSVRDKIRLNEIMSKYHPDFVYHAAAHKHVPLVEDSPLEGIANNVFGTYNVISTCIENKVKRFTLISTDKAVNTTNVMGATKRMCELVIQLFKDNGVTKLSAVRFGNVLGSNGSVIPLFKEQIKNGGPVTVTDPNIVRYFMTIAEASQLVIQSSLFSENGELFVLDMGKPVKILKLAEDLISLSGFQPYKDIDIKFVGLRPGEKMYEELIQNKEEFTKTDNDLIFITKTVEVDKNSIKVDLDRLHKLVDNRDMQNARNVILDIVKKY